MPPRYQQRVGGSDGERGEDTLRSYPNAISGRGGPCGAVGHVYCERCAAGAYSTLSGRIRGGERGKARGLY
jgi:hypothetical protein